MIRVVFLGTPDFAVPSLSALAEDPNIEVCAAVTPPDRRAGRGQKRQACPVKRVARGLGVECHTFARIRGNPEAIELLEAVKPDLCVVVAFGQILPVEFFDRPPLGTVNVHASLLPAYRGAAPIIHAVLNGEEKSGVTIMKIDEGMDTGDILETAEVEVGPNMTAGELEGRLAPLGGELLVSTILRYAAGEIDPQPQDDEEASYAPMIDREHARIRWDSTAREIHNRIRAMNPRPGSFARYGEESVKIWRSQVVRSEGRPSDVSGGQVVEIGNSGEIVVAAGAGGTLALLELQRPGKARISALDFVNGTGIEVGDLFL